MKIDRKTEKEIMRLITIYKQKEKAAKQAEEQLEKFVYDFMENAGMMDNAEDVKEMVLHLPSSNLRFILLVQYMELKKMAKNQEAELSQSPTETISQSFG